MATPVSVPVAVYRWADIRFGVPSSQPASGTPTLGTGTPTSHNTQPDFSQWRSYALGALRFFIEVVDVLLAGAILSGTGGPPGGVARWGGMGGGRGGGGRACMEICRE